MFDQSWKVNRQMKKRHSEAMSKRAMDKPHLSTKFVFLTNLPVKAIFE